MIATVAGGVGGPALATKVSLSLQFCGVSYGAGALYLGGGFSVRKITPQTGGLTTPAGTGTNGPLRTGKLATTAALHYVCYTAVDRAGNLIIADAGNLIRVVAKASGTFYGQAMTAGRIYTVAGDGHSGFSGDGGPATSAKLDNPKGVVVDAAGNLVLADYGANRLRVVAVKTGTFYGQAMTAGDIYTVAGGGLSRGDGVPATSAFLSEPEGVAVDGAGNLLIADAGSAQLQAVAAATGTSYGQPMTAGDVYTVAGGNSDSGGIPATQARVFPVGVAVDHAGNLLIADRNNQRVWVVAETSGTFYGRPMIAGRIYRVAGGVRAGFSGDGGPATRAKLYNPQAVTVDAAGNVVIADTTNNRIRVVAETSGTFYGQPMTAGDIYTVAGDGTSGFSGDGGQATAAELSQPQGVAADGAGNLVISDTGSNRVRVVAAATGTYYGRAMTARDIYTVAGDNGRGFNGDGGPATSTELASPTGVTVDAAGNVVIADESNERVRVVAESPGTFYGRAMTAGDVYTVAGTGRYGFYGDGGQATKAGLYNPTGVAVHGGNLVVSDTNHGRIRVVGG